MLLFHYFLPKTGGFISICKSGTTSEIPEFSNLGHIPITNILVKCQSRE